MTVWQQLSLKTLFSHPRLRVLGVKKFQKNFPQNTNAKMTFVPYKYINKGFTGTENGNMKDLNLRSLAKTPENINLMLLLNKEYSNRYRSIFQYLTFKLSY